MHASLWRKLVCGGVQEKVKLHKQCHFRSNSLKEQKMDKSSISQLKHLGWVKGYLLSCVMLFFSPYYSLFIGKVFFQHQKYDCRPAFWKTSRVILVQGFWNRVKVIAFQLGAQDKVPSHVFATFFFGKYQGNFVFYN